MIKQACLSLSLLLAMVLILTSCSAKNYDYKSAQNECVAFLESNKAEITALAEDVIDQHSSDALEYKGYSVEYMECDDMQYAVLDFNSQGALGGQYWGLYYSPDDEFCSEYGETVLDENRRYYKEQGGNNLFASERLCENWFFYYQDYDGNNHNLDWDIT